MKNPDLAQEFHRLHRGPGVLLLANAWDVGSARLIASLGAPAIATTSAGVAWTLGYPDGNAVPVRLVLELTAAIARAIRVPLTVDAEAGYSDDPIEVGALIAGLIEAGAVGINLEDGGGAPDLLCAKIAECRRVANQAGVELFINARTDIYLRGIGPEADRLAETCARGTRYRAAGASGLFVPGLVDATAIGAIARAVALPLNVLVSPGMPAPDALATLGARRLSAGSAIAQAVWGRAAALASGFLRDGLGVVSGEGAMTYRDLNALVTRT